MYQLILTIVLVLTVPPQGGPTFDVAVVKPNPQRQNANRSGCRGIDTKLTPADPRNSIPIGRCVFIGARLDSAISFAHEFPTQWMRGGPQWIRTDGYDIEATAENPASTSENQLRQMLKALLEDRFKLKYRREIQEVPGFALTIDRGGPKLQKATGAEEPFVLTTVLPNATLVATRTSMATFAKEMLSKANLCLGAPLSPVVDRTGLEGVYAFRMAWTLCRGEVVPGSDNTIPYALKDLGLKLEAAKVPQEILFIDNVERP